jgi:outer membrane protein TolC
LLAGCHGIQTEGEKEARRDFQAASITRTPSARKAEKLLSDSNLSNVVAFALMNSPKVEAAYRDWEASIERITQSRSLPDPQLTFQMDIANIVTSIMPGLMMNLPGPGKLRAGADVASAQSQAKYFQFQTAVLESAFEVKQRYYQLLLQSEKIRVNQETLRLLTDLESLALTQNEVGKVTLQDVLRAQIEQEKLKNEIANLQDSRGLYVERFKAALGLTPADPAPPMPERFESTDFDVSADKLFDLALAKNTRLKAMESEVRAAEASIILASKARIPDASLGLMADVKMSPVFYRPLATVSLPVWRDKIKAEIAEAQAARRSAEARLSAEQIALAVDFLERKFLYREVNRNLELLDEQLLPRARRSLEVARSGYLAGQIDFLNLTDSERTLLAFELERVESGTQREIILAELSLIIEGMPPSGGAERMNTGIGPARTAGTGRVTGNMNSMR